MNRYTAAFLFAFTAAASAQEFEVEYYDGRPAVAGELLVKFRDGADGSRKLRGDTVRMRRFQVREAIDLGGSGYTHLKLSSRQGRRTLLELAQDPEVDYVEPNYIIQEEQTTSNIPNDPNFARQWGLRNSAVSGADIDAVTAWATTRGSRTNVIGVIDTGVDYNHPDLRDNMWTAPREFTVTFGPNDRITCPAGSRGYNSFTNTCDPMDVRTHGTNVAGVIAATGNNAVGVTGVNWTSSIMGLAFMNPQGQGSVAHAIRAIEFAIQAKQVLGTGANLRVLNASWGGSGFSQALLQQITKAWTNSEMLFVAAAGNTPTNRDVTPDYPSSYNAKNLVSVAATDERDGLASFSAFGANTVHLGAPGVGIFTTAPDSQYASVSGTSFAAPMTSGVAGLVLAACGPLDTLALRSAILDNASPIPSLAGKTSTGARLNAFRAVRSCASPSTPLFRLTGAPFTGLTLFPGGNVVMPMQITASGGFRNPVALSITGLPSTMTAVFTPASATPGTPVSLRITASPQAVISTTPIAAVIRGVSGNLDATMMVNVRVSPPFTVAVVPGLVTLNPGMSLEVPVQVVGATGFTGQVALTASGLPAGVTAVFTPASVAPGTPAALRLTAAPTAALTGTTVAAAIRGTGSGTTSTAELGVRVTPAPTFDIGATPAMLSVDRGGTATFTVVVRRLNGFNQPVSLTFSGLPAGTTTTRTVVDQETITLQIATTANTAVRMHSITVTGSAGTLRKVATLSLNVRP